MNEDKASYIRFLESAVSEDAEAIDVPSTYTGLQSPVRNWDGNSSLPNISKEEDLDEVVNKILKKSPDDEGTADPNRDEGKARIAEVGNLANDAQAKVEGDSEQDEEDKDADCPDCEKKIQEIYQELGISPLALLEEDDGEDDEDDEDDKSGEGASDENKDGKWDEGKKPFPGAAEPFTKKDAPGAEGGEAGDENPLKEGFTKHETRILEQLIKEMGLVEEDEASDAKDDLSDEDSGEEGETEDELDFGDSEQEND